MNSKYRDRGEALKRTVQGLDSAARSASPEAQRKAALDVLVALTGGGSDWVERLPVGVSPAVIRARDRVSGLGGRPLQEAVGCLAEEELPPLFMALEGLVRAALADHDRAKPDDLRGLARRRRVLTGLGFCVGAVILAGAWLGYAWLNPQGMRVTYFHDQNLTRPAAHRVANRIDFDYGRNRPVWNVSRRQGWSARWEGTLAVPADDAYEFYVQSMAGVRVYLDGRRVVDNWREQEWGASGRHFNARLGKGAHSLMIEHYSTGGSAGLRLKWMGGGIPPNTVLATPYLRK